LSEMIGMPYPCITNMRIGNNLIEYTTYELPTHKYKEINTHELVHKCKEWAWTKNYEIVERKTRVDVYKNNKRVAQFIGDNLVIFLPSRVYEACEWIKYEL